jgi:hypothetical protein
VGGGLGLKDRMAGTMLSTTCRVCSLEVAVLQDASIHHSVWSDWLGVRNVVLWINTEPIKPHTAMS